MRILVAEDQQPLALHLKRTLEAMGHHADVAPDGEQAWSKLQSSDFSVLISDATLPKLSANNLCRRVRTHLSDRYVYIMLQIGQDQANARLEALSAGADDFLAKPVDHAELAIRLQIADRILGVHQKLALQSACLNELATTDDLTGVSNRRCFEKNIEILLSQASRIRLPLSLILLDVDHFKSYNDSFGHPAGDNVLRHLGSTLLTTLRQHDFVARYGGEEFAILLPATSTAHAGEVAERLRLSIENQPWPFRPITASFGVATAHPPAHSDLKHFVERADQALYLAKRLGRNRVAFQRDLPCSAAI